MKVGSFDGGEDGEHKGGGFIEISRKAVMLDISFHKAVLFAEHINVRRLCLSREWQKCPMIINASGMPQQCTRDLIFGIYSAALPRWAFRTTLTCCSRAKMMMGSRKYSMAMGYSGMR